MEKRRGKPVTILSAEGIPDTALRLLAKEFKALCGTGGTLKEAEIELQGEHRERLRPLLVARGYRVKG
jgi:translation initiation factor 1